MTVLTPVAHLLKNEMFGLCPAWNGMAESFSFAGILLRQGFEQRKNYGLTFVEKRYKLLNRVCSQVRLAKVENGDIPGAVLHVEAGWMDDPGGKRSL